MFVRAVSYAHPMGDLVHLDPAKELAELEAARKRYDELRAAKPTRGSEDWKELMRLGRVVSGNMGGRPKKLTVKEAREQALKEMYPKALKVLEKQLDSDDPGIAQRAALRVVDQVEGKAAQTIKEEKIHKIVYETAAATEQPA